MGFAIASLVFRSPVLSRFIIRGAMASPRRKDHPHRPGSVMVPVPRRVCTSPPPCEHFIAGLAGDAQVFTPRGFVSVSSLGFEKSTRVWSGCRWVQARVRLGARPHRKYLVRVSNGLHVECDNLQAWAVRRGDGLMAACTSSLVPGMKLFPYNFPGPLEPAAPKIMLAGATESRLLACRLLGAPNSLTPGDLETIAGFSKDDFDLFIQFWVRGQGGHIVGPRALTDVLHLKFIEFGYGVGQGVERDENLEELFITLKAARELGLEEMRCYLTKIPPAKILSIEKSCKSPTYYLAVDRGHSVIVNGVLLLAPHSDMLEGDSGPVIEGISSPPCSSGASSGSDSGSHGSGQLLHRAPSFTITVV